MWDNVDVWDKIRQIERVTWLTMGANFKVQMTEFLDELNKIRKFRNEGGHTSEKISVEKAQKIIDLICSVIRKIDEYFI